MGMIDPLPSVLKMVPKAPRQTGRLTGVGITAVGFGFLVFTVGVLAGFNLILVLVGLGFVAGGAIAKPRRLCPACKLAVPAGASICGHCRTELS